MPISSLCPKLTMLRITNFTCNFCFAHIIILISLSFRTSLQWGCRNMPNFSCKRLVSFDSFYQNAKYCVLLWQPCLKTMFKFSVSNTFILIKRYFSSKLVSNSNIFTFEKNKYFLQLLSGSWSQGRHGHVDQGIKLKPNGPAGMEFFSTNINDHDFTFNAKMPL